MPKVPEKLDSPGEGEGCGMIACHINYPRYLVEESGNVISLVFKSPRKLKPIRRGEYWGFTLLDAGGKLCGVYQHRLVAEVFHGAAPEGHEVRHLNGNRANNSAANVTWGTRSQNMLDKELHGTAPIGEAHPMAKLDEQRVRIMRKLHALGFSPSSMMAYFKISRMQHWRIVHRQLWRHIL